MDDECYHWSRPSPLRQIPKVNYKEPSKEPTIEKFGEHHEAKVLLKRKRTSSTGMTIERMRQKGDDLRQGLEVLREKIAGMELENEKLREVAHNLM